MIDVISIERTNETSCLLYDVKGRYTVHRITVAEGQFELRKVKVLHVAKENIPFITTNDGRTIRTQISRNPCHDPGGRDVGRVGVIRHREKLLGAFNIIHVKDSAGHSFATRVSNVFVIGKGNEALVSLPASKGIRLTIAEERDKRFSKEGLNVLLLLINCCYYVLLDHKEVSF